MSGLWSEEVLLAPKRKHTAVASASSFYTHEEPKVLYAEYLACASECGLVSFPASYNKNVRDECAQFMGQRRLKPLILSPQGAKVNGKLLANLRPLLEEILVSSIQQSLQPKLDQLECHFTWDIKKVNLVLTDVLNRLEEQLKMMGLGWELGVARTHCSLGYLEFLLEHKERALTHLLKSETLIKEKLGENCDKTLIVTYGNLAWINYHMKNYSECESYLMKLLKINETLPTQPSSVPEVLGEKGWAYLKFSHKYCGRAVEVFQKAVELDPENSEWNAGYAKALYRIEPSTSCTVDSPAIKQLRLAIDDNPDDNASRSLLGLKLWFCSKKLMDESEKLVETALNGSPEDPHVIRKKNQTEEARGTQAEEARLR
ncbi:interferon-induced protein with tetratricopeptide repeats [Pimephales promelas]|nr:interferon-induced protein with tetratricopeptide repeats [Pimephales promelas]